MTTIDRRTVLASGVLALAGTAVQGGPAEAQAGPKAMFPVAATTIPIVGEAEVFQVRRIYCIGRNYAEHAREMGMPVERDVPMFFCKPADAIVAQGADGADIAVAYPSVTNDLHHEVEMVVALASGGKDIPVDQALAHVFGYAIGLDLTRRDLQAAAKAKGWPWDVAKAFDHSAPISTIQPVSVIGHPAHVELTLEVNGERRQHGYIADMLFSVAEIIHELSKLFELKAGDLIYTGTPAGVAALKRGDRFHAALGGIAELRGTIV